MLRWLMLLTPVFAFTPSDLPSLQLAVKNCCDNLDVNNGLTDCVVDTSGNVDANGTHIADWDTSNVNSFYRFWKYNNAWIASSCRQNFNANISNWDVSEVTDMYSVFGSSIRKFNQDLPWDVSKVTRIDNMFYQAREFNGVISNWDVSKVTNMKATFREAFDFNSDISKWDVSKVTRMDFMFARAEKFDQDLPWDVSKVTTMQTMFWNAKVFNGDISNWDVSKVINANSMFKDATAFNQHLNSAYWAKMYNTANIGNIDWDSGVTFGWSPFDITSLKAALELCCTHGSNDLTDCAINLSGAYDASGTSISAWDTSILTSLATMLPDNCRSTFNADISAWDVSSVNNMISTFEGAVAFNKDISSWDVSNVQDMSSTFEGAVAFNNDISSWNVSNVQDMRSLFKGAAAFNQPLPWNVHNVVDMSSTFEGAAAFNQPLPWDARSVKSALDMFKNTIALNQHVISPHFAKLINLMDLGSNTGVTIGWSPWDSTTLKAALESCCTHGSNDLTDCAVQSNGAYDASGTSISAWDTSIVTVLNNMLPDNCKSTFNADISAWDVNSVIDMSSTFEGAAAFNQPLPWDVSNVVYMSSTFEGAAAFNQPLPWDVSRVKDMRSLFKGAAAFNQPLPWNVSRVKDMRSLFKGAAAFNQPLAWDVSNVNDMSSAFYGAVAFNQQLDWDVRRARDMNYMFHDSTNIIQPFTISPFAITHNMYNSADMNAICVIVSCDMSQNINVNGYSGVPAFADLDNDGDLDLIVGESHGTLKYYENTGSDTDPAYTNRNGATNPFAGIDVGVHSSPALADLDNDGDLDLIIGDDHGNLYYYENTGDVVNPTYTSTTNIFSGITINGNRITPALADLDNDGDLDLINGNDWGFVYYYENTGSATDPVYTSTTNPFNGFDVGAYSSPALADLDNDGDLDLFVGEYDGNLNYYENTGTATVPAYTVRNNFFNPFGEIDVGMYSAPAFADLDNDGDLDLFIGSNDGMLVYYENTGNSTAIIDGNPIIPDQGDPFDGIQVGVEGDISPAFADLDNDGDLDLITGFGWGRMYYYENTGSIVNAVYTYRSGVDNPFDGIDVGTYNKPAFADLDNDGDMDLIIGESDGTLNYYENTGTIVNPVYTSAPNPFSGIDVGDRSDPALADLDNDGDLDLVIGEQHGNLNYYENTGNITDPAYTVRTGATNPFNGFDVGDGSAPALADLDNDGDMDLIIGEHVGNLNYYENTGDAYNPTYTSATNPFLGIDVGWRSTPALADLDNDGDLDLIVGSYSQFIDYYENVGNNIHVSYHSAYNPFHGIDVGVYSKPAFADLDNDGDMDLIIGEEDGILNYYENTRSITDPVYTSTTNPFSGIDVGFRSAPAFADLDNDGDLDLVIGEYDGILNYYENTGTATVPAYTVRSGAANPFNGIDVGYDSTPALADVDNDGDIDLIIGESDGTLNYYGNTGSATNPVYTQYTGVSNPFNGIDVGDYSAPAFIDLNNAGDLLLIVGERDAFLNYYVNTGSATDPVYTSTTNKIVTKNVLRHSTPAVFIENDEVVLVIGSYEGTLSNKYTSTIGPSSINTCDKFACMDTFLKNTMTTQFIEDLLVAKNSHTIPFFEDILIKKYKETGTCVE